MRRRLPPLNALKAFEAAARHLSFAAAAREMCITAAAISQQVRRLEQEIGVRLFLRKPRGLALTDEGRRYGRDLARLFDAMADATHTVRRHATAGEITLCTVPSLAARWLVPRLASFNRAHPDVAVRVMAETSPAAIDASDADLVIRYGDDRHPGIVGELPFPRAIFPVCSPDLAGGAHPIRVPADLAKHLLLQIDDARFPAGHDDCDWPRWFRRVGLADANMRYSPSFSFSHLMLQAAVAGQGVAITSLALSGDDLAAGRLVRPLPHEVAGERGYWLSRGRDAADTERCDRFVEWLMREVRAFAAA